MFLTPPTRLSFLIYTPYGKQTHCSWGLAILCRAGQAAAGGTEGVCVLPQHGDAKGRAGRQEQSVLRCSGKHTEMEVGA